MAKRNVKTVPKRRKPTKIKAVTRKKTTEVEFLSLLIAQTAKYLNLSDGRPDKGSVAQLARLQAELAALVGGKK